MTAPCYALLSTFDRLPSARLDELLAEVQERPPLDGYQMAAPGTVLRTKADKIAVLERAKGAWREASAASKPLSQRPSRPFTAPAPTRTQGGPQSITGRPSSAQALAIFAAIPACPVWGADPCTCALCTPQKATSP